MNNDWEGTEYTVCPICKEVVTKESLRNHTHICLKFVKQPPIADL